MKPLVAKALEIALSQEGVREHGSNRGPQVERYLAAGHTRPGEPWCACFVFWACEQAAAALSVPNPWLRSAYCPTLANWSREEGILVQQPAAGDVFLRYGRNERGSYVARHTGFVTGVIGGKFSTIEGNSNLNGSREGIGVFRLNRTLTGSYRFARWQRLVEDTLGAVYRLMSGGKVVAEMPIRHGRSLCPLRSWAAMLGFELGWDQESQAVTLDGHEVPVQISHIGEVSYAPIRELAAAAGLILDVDGAHRTVTVRRP